MPLVKSQKALKRPSDILTLESDKVFSLESGKALSRLTIAYTTHGQLNDDKSNAVWVFHGLTANADPVEWWPEFVGENKLIDTNKYFVICANVLGSCYGTTGPKSKNPETGDTYGSDFPLVSVKDMVRAHQLLQKHLGINKIYLGLGSSLGGQQLLEWAVTESERFDNVVVIAANAKHSAWGIALNETQRMALEAGDFKSKGLEAARAIALLSYRNQDTYRKTQTDHDDKLIDDFKASSYQRYQGLKLSNRFDSYSYYYLSKAMDSHNIGRGRKSVRHALKTISCKTLCIGIKSDLLFPVGEQKFIAKNIKGSVFKSIDSLYGHDGFLIESEAIGKILKDFLNRN